MSAFGKVSSIAEDYLRMLLVNVFSNEFAEIVVPSDPMLLEKYKVYLAEAINICVFAGSTLVKIPQIFKIVSNNSTEGLAPASYLMESLSLVLYFSYGYRARNPIMSYIDCAAILMQNFYILSRIIKSRKNPAYVKASIAGLCILTALLCSDYVDMRIVSALQWLTLMLAVLAKLPQVKMNYTNKSCGQTSPITIFAQAGGAAAKTVSNILADTGASLVICNFCTFILSMVIFVQIFVYMPRKKSAARPKKSKRTKKHAATQSTN